MNGCLSNYELWRAYEGEAPGGDLAHLRTCSACATRRARLAHDMRAVSGVLRGAAPRFRRPATTIRSPWKLAAAIAAGIALLAGVEAAMWRHSKVIVEPSQEALETTVLLEDVAAMLSPGDVVSLAALPSEDTGIGDEPESVTADETGVADVGAL